MLVVFTSVEAVPPHCKIELLVFVYESAQMLRYPLIPEFGAPLHFCSVSFLTYQDLQYLDLRNVPLFLDCRA